MAVLRGIAEEKDAGRLVKFYVRGDMGVSYRQFSALKTTGGLRVNGEIVHANYVLSAGDAVEVTLTDAPRPQVIAEDLPVNVVYEDDDLLIIDKPAPLACQCSDRQPVGTLENRLAWRYRADAGFVFRPLNRLDRGTSGLMAAAKHAHACQRMQRQLHTEDFVREYLAVTEGEWRGRGIIDLPISKEDAATVRRIIDRERGQSAVTHYETLTSVNGRTLVRLRLETGRTHQIRVHLSHIGHPIVGDFLYGTEVPELPQRFALHSAHIELKHPVTGRRVSADSPLPPELEGLL